MAKKEKKPRPLRNIILAGLGKAWMHWPPRMEAKMKAKDRSKPGMWFICAMCKQSREKVQIDHIIPCVRPAEGWTSWDDYIKSRFVESASQLQALCHECHREKSKKENAERRAAKKLLKGKK